MQDVKNVLVPLEHSQATDRALDEVGLLASSDEVSEVTLLETLGPVPPRLLETGGATDRAEERRQHAELAAARKEWFEEARRQEGPRVRHAEQRLVDAGVARERIHRDYVMMIPEDDVARVVLDRAREQGCTRIVVGRPHVPWWRTLFTRRLDEELAARAPGGSWRVRLPGRPAQAASGVPQGAAVSPDSLPGIVSLSESMRDRAHRRDGHCAPKRLGEGVLPLHAAAGWGLHPPSPAEVVRARGSDRPGGRTSERSVRPARLRLHATARRLRLDRRLPSMEGDDMQPLSHYARPLAAPLVGIAFALLTLAPSPARAESRTPTDVDIRDAIEAEYLVDPVVSFSDVETAVRNGIVTLTGNVDHLRAKRRAVRIAGVVRGVRSVVDRLEVRPLDVRSDELVREDVEEALLRDPATDSIEVEVTVEDGAVTLSGDVDSWPERRLAVAVASGVRGVTSVDDDQFVVSHLERPDEEIRADIERSLAWDVLLDAGRIDVAVQGGRVTLSGVVGSTAEKARAKVRAQIQGVERVDASDLEVAAWWRDEDLRRRRFPLREDAEVQAAVDSALLVDPRVSAFGLKVDVDEGVATLRGTVGNLKARHAAVDDARNTVGVLRVRDRIRVKPEPMANKDLARRVREALQRDPIVEAYEISVACEDGVVTLTGRVDSWFERSVADDVVSRVRGVSAVDDEIVVTDVNTPLIWKPLVDDMLLHQLTWQRMHPAPVLVDQEQIQTEVENQIFWSPFVSLDDVDVSVDGAVVTLTGEVGSWVGRLAAAMNAYEAGATWVENEIRIRPPSAARVTEDAPGP